MKTYEMQAWNYAGELTNQDHGYTRITEAEADAKLIFADDSTVATIVVFDTDSLKEVARFNRK